jgi:uncharacterized DUF497 family protein
MRLTANGNAWYYHIGSRSEGLAEGGGLRIREFEWDEGNILHLTLGHGIEPDEAEEALAVAPLVRRTKKGHYAAFGRTNAGRLLVIVFERKTGGSLRVITGWDMNTAEKRFYRRSRRRSSND